MKKNLSSISKAGSHEEMGEFWDSHDLTDFWEQTKPAHFDVNIQSEIFFYALDKTLSDRIQTLAKKRGVSADTLVNLWIQEKLHEQAPGKNRAHGGGKRN